MTEAKWFNRLSPCAGTVSIRVANLCGKPSVGILMGSRNEVIGPRCERCAGRAIAGIVKPPPSSPHRKAWEIMVK